jgi:AcrR family transcriptional regulator
MPFWSVAGMNPARVARERADRDTLLGAAEQVFADQGYAGTRMKDIAAATGLSNAAIYGLYDGKAAIWAAVHERRLADVLAAAAASIVAERASDALLGGTEALVRWFAAHPTYLQMNLREGQSWATADHYASLAQVDGWRQGVAMMTGLFRAGQADGDLVPGNPELHARLLSATHQVFIAQWVEGSRTQPLDALVAELQATIRRTFFVRETP